MLFSREAEMAGAVNDSTVVSGVVPSLRIDVLGARAFRVSRAWFARGVATAEAIRSASASALPIRESRCSA